MEGMLFTKECLPLAEGTGLHRRYAVRQTLGGDTYGIRYGCFDFKAGQTVWVLEYFPRELAIRQEGSNAVSPKNRNCGPLFFEGAEAFFNQYQGLTQAIGNPNIISVFDAFFENGTAYAVLEPLDGVTLTEYLKMKAGLLCPEELMYIASAMSDALLVVHSLNLLHCGITCDSIFLCTDATVKLTDFCAARRTVQSGRKPEMDQTELDLFGLGQALRCSGTANFKGTGDPANPIPPVLLELLDRMTSREEGVRFQSVFDFRHALCGMDLPKRKPAVTILSVDAYRKRKAEQPPASRAEATPSTENHWKRNEPQPGKKTGKAGNDKKKLRILVLYGMMVAAVLLIAIVIKFFLRR